VPYCQKYTPTDCFFGDNIMTGGESNKRKFGV